MKKIGIINGPNLNLLGKREVNIYGSESFDSFLNQIRKKYENRVEIFYFQSNIEGELVGEIQKMAFEYGCDAIVLNAAAYTHTSVAILDAIKAVEIPVVEVHISQVAAREEFRRTSLIGSACKASISGFGFNSYSLAIEGLLML